MKIGVDFGAGVPHSGTELRFRMFGVAAEYRMSTAQLESLLERFSGDSSVYEAWAADNRIRHKEYLKQLISSSETPSRVRAVTAICRLIETEAARRVPRGVNYSRELRPG